MNRLKRNKLKHKLKERKLTFGSWITIGNPIVAEIMARSGFEWLTIDMGHSSITLDMVQRLVRIVELNGVTPLVRVGENNPNLIKRVMDTGSHGVIVPLVNNKDDALRAVNAVKYPPAGKRGVGLARAQGYGLSFDEYKNWLNKNSIVIVQIEHVDGVNNLESILQVEGVDASIIGPYDLSASMGYPGEFNRKEVKEVIKRYINVCRDSGKIAGFHVVPPDAGEVKKKVKEGFGFLAFSLDTLFLANKCVTELSNTRRSLKKSSGGNDENKKAGL